MIDLFVYLWYTYFLLYWSGKQYPTCIDNLKILIFINQLILPLGPYPKKEKTTIGGKAYITALFTLGNNLKQPKHPLKIYQYSYVKWSSWKFTSHTHSPCATLVLYILWRVIVKYSWSFPKPLAPHCFIHWEHVIWLRGESPTYHRSFRA